MSHAYRSAYQHLVGTRLAEMKLEATSLEPFLPRLRQLRSTRIARIVAGTVGIVGALMMVVSAGFDWTISSDALIGGGIAAACAYVLARVFFSVANRYAHVP